jgi:hypothetical protein
MAWFLQGISIMAKEKRDTKRWWASFGFPFPPVSLHPQTL